jgi:flagellar FliL protein
LANKEKKLGAKKILIPGLIFVVLIGGAGYFFSKSGKIPFLPGAEAKKVASASSQEAEKEDTAYKQLPLESLVVNLSDPGGNRYLRVTITVEYTDGKVEKELQRSMHRIRDAIIQVLRSKTVADLVPGKAEKVKKELLDTVNGFLKEGKITGLYFQEFLIQ